LIIGSAKQVIADFTSKHGIDVVVMGAIHHPGIERIIGSTTEQALYKVKTSILAVQA
ncbi:TPA: universal stress protein, partial [Pseudomonas aeruginosa]|nr:universal stress protein [Pseudomonas aeruginosa]HBN8680036.1 universal stress protein [Pseudomonas aeruginosa]